jgi:adenine-specific DNA-methyltransferase
MGNIRLTWDGKSSALPRLKLPLQVVETVNSPRANRGTIFEALNEPGESEWRNKLIWGDNLHALASLADDHAGEVDLVYIDPPFDSRQDYMVRIAVGDGGDSADTQLSKLASIVEEKAYRDTWGKGVDSYLQMLYQRLLIIHELLSDRGSLFLHLAPNVSHLARVLLDEIFGPENFRAEVIWKRTPAHADTKDFGTIHDSILCFSKTEKHIWNPHYEPYDSEYIKQYFRFDDGDGRLYWRDNLTAPGIRRGETGQVWRGFDPNLKGRHWTVPPSVLEKLDSEGRIYWSTRGSGFPQIKRYLDEAKGMPIGDVWTDVKRINQMARERLGYDTQKPEALLERIIKSSSNEGSVVLDCFVGSGTTAAVAERLGRRWIAVDIGRFAIHTTRKRLLDIPNCRPFEVANLGHYERQAWKDTTTGTTLQAYLNFIIRIYGGTPLDDGLHVHGTKGPRALHIGAVDAPVTATEVTRSVEEASEQGYVALDVLGWEFELGLHDLVADVARSNGVDLHLRRIPREIMDPRAVDAGDVVFHELAYLEVGSKVVRRTIHVSLENFAIPNPELVPPEAQRQVRSWADYVDYWAVDFTYRMNGQGDTFHNQWQSFRTRASRTLEMTASYEYGDRGEYKVLVKVVDIFGNDTTTSVPVVIKK